MSIIHERKTWNVSIYKPNGVDVFEQMTVEPVITDNGTLTIVDTNGLKHTTTCPFFLTEFKSKDA